MNEFLNEFLPFIKMHPVLALIWICLFIAIIYMSIKVKLSKVIIITNDQATALINKEDAIVIDLRSNDHFRKGHLLDAKNILPVDIKNNSIQSIEKYKSHPIIITDDNGTTVHASGELLVKNGFEKVFALKEGVSGWINGNLPLVKK